MLIFKANRPPFLCQYNLLTSPLTFFYNKLRFENILMVNVFRQLYPVLRISSQAKLKAMASNSDF